MSVPIKVLVDVDVLERLLDGDDDPNVYRRAISEEQAQELRDDIQRARKTK